MKKRATHGRNGRVSEKTTVAACTIISRNYLSHARILAESFRRHHPDAKFYALVIDGLPEGTEFGDGVHVLAPDVLELPYFYELCFKYDVTELSTAVKPSLLLSLLRSFGEQNVVYFDPDILITRPLSELFTMMRRSNVVLTPHLLAPIPVDGLKPSEQDILRDGAYNLGFIAIRRCDESERFLKWWEERLRHFCRIDPVNGLFTDQKWINLIPGLFENVSVLRDDTYNVAYWNLHSRPLTFNGKQFLVNGQPLAFFHFSGFDPNRPQVLSKHQTRTTVVASTPLAQLLDCYARLQGDHGYADSTNWHYGCSQMRNGVCVHSLLRRLYLDLDPETRLRFGDPFDTDHPGSFLAWATTPSAEYRNLSPFLHEVYRVRYDVAAAYPDLSGADRERFLDWARTQGVKEMGYDPRLVDDEPARTSPPLFGVTRNEREIRNFAEPPRVVQDAPSSRIPVRASQQMSHMDYEKLIAKNRTIAEACVPPGAVIAVASKGDNDLLALPGRTGWHFPQTNDGAFAGFYPADSAQAIAHLEILRKRGAEFLLFPATAAWWLDYYCGLKEHLQSQYKQLEVDAGQCVIFDLRNARVDGSPTVRVFGVNVAGYVASEKGMGEGVRSDLRGLEAAGIPFAINNFVDTGSQNVDSAYQSFAEDNPYSINLIHINADQVPGFAKTYGDAYFKGRCNIGYWAWELSSFPQKWRDSFRYFDEIWVPSNFVLDAVSREAPVPVVRIPHTLPETLPTSSATRATFAIPDNQFVFLFMFDCHSYIERKHPFGLIKAFRDAFDASDGALLVLKCSHASLEHLQQLRDAAAGANLLILNAVFTREETNSLVSLCDCYVSLHRSEGFGLTMAEAMSFEKPVIATGYSGNMDFMTVANSFPVRYSLTEITENHGPYRKGNVWADPDLGHASELMRFVYEHPEVASAVGRRARRDVLDTLHPRVVGKMMSCRLAHAAEAQRLKASQEEAAPMTTAALSTKSDPYAELVKAIRELTDVMLPAEATVLVVSRGDEQLLQLGSRRGLHFPQDPGGKYAGHHPRDSEDAISRLESLREQGADYLLFPCTAFWWLSYYSELRNHLESQYRRIWADGRCLIYQLAPNESRMLVTVRSQLDDTALAFQQLTGALQASDTRAKAAECALSAITVRLDEQMTSFDDLRSLVRSSSEQTTLRFEQQQAGLEQQQAELTQVAITVGGIRNCLAARPYMSCDVFGTNDLNQPMGYSLDAAAIGKNQDAPKGFADLFRGPEPFIADRQRVYLPFLQGRQHVVDLGCGRGEFLRLLHESGIAAVGVELEPKLVARLRGEGLNVVAADAVEYLREQPEASIDAIFSAQVIEHLDSQRLMDLLRLAKARLRPGGILIAETVNPESFQALKAFSVDLTHQHPIFPQVLLQMCREAGFATARIFYPLGGGFTQTQYALVGEYAVVAVAA